MNTVEKSHLFVAELIKNVKRIYQMPEVVIDDYFASLRNDVDIRTETLLVSLELGSENERSINSRRTSMISEINRIKDQCQIRLMQDYPSLNISDYSEMEHALEEIQKEHIVKKTLSLEEIKNVLEKYTYLKEQVEDILLEERYRILMNRSFVFMEGEETLGLLLIMNEICLTDAETKWIKYELSRMLSFLICKH